MSLDMSMFPVPNNADIQVFNCTALSSADNSCLSCWRKPRGVSMVFIFALGAGGGGGGGNASASSGSGGGGGASGNQALGLFPSIFIPNTLHVIVGKGGVGGVRTDASGTPGAVGTNGTSSYVLVKFDTNLRTYNTLLGTSSGFSNANFGTNGFSTIGATGGSASGPPGISFSNMAGMGLVQFIGGQSGASGSFNANGGSITPPTTGLLVTGGCGGAGSNSSAFNGGAFLTNASTWFNTIVPQASATNGSNGFLNQKPFFGFGGCGGGTSSGITSTNSKGGKGGIGCGGGGGAGFTSVDAGDGGDGGDGIVIICSW